MGQFRQPDHSLGDANTLGGYMAVHERPAAFEGSDGFSYSVDVVAEPSGDPARPWAASLLFVQWARIGAASPSGHLETEYLAWGATGEEAERELRALRLDAVRRVLEELIRARHGGAPARRWWDAMHADEPGEDA
jgi:hypothetical protein